MADETQDEKMVSLKFKAWGSLNSYIQHPKDLLDGDVKEFPENEAKRLLKDFPKNFSRTQAEPTDDKKSLEEIKKIQDKTAVDQETKIGEYHGEDEE